MVLLSSRSENREYLGPNTENIKKRDQKQIQITRKKKKEKYHEIVPKKNNKKKNINTQKDFKDQRVTVRKDIVIYQFTKTNTYYT
jgi:hypothetical protein